MRGLMPRRAATSFGPMISNIYIKCSKLGHSRRYRTQGAFVGHALENLTRGDTLPLTERIMAKIFSISSGDHRAAVLARRDALVEQHLDLVPPIARAIAASLPRSFELDDLIATGYVGLLHAATRYRPSEHGDTPFSAYARPVVRGAILDSVRRKHYVENTRPSCAEMPDPAYTPNMEAVIDADRERERVTAAVEGLAPRLRNVVELHYAEDMRLPAVGARLSVGKSRASQLHMAAVRELRAELAPVAAESVVRFTLTAEVAAS